MMLHPSVVKWWNKFYKHYRYILIEYHSFSLLNLSFRFFLGRFFFIFPQSLSVNADCFIKLNFKALVLFFRSEFGTELLSFWLLIWNIMGSPSPAVVACFKLFQLAKDVFLNDIMVHDAFVSLISSD